MDSGLECLKNVSVSDDPKIASFALHTSDSWETVNRLSGRQWRFGCVMDFRQVRCGGPLAGEPSQPSGEILLLISLQVQQRAIAGTICDWG
jgi:hypothetical protein